MFLAREPDQKYFSVKIGDLGVAKLLDTSTAFAKTIVGTPYYLSPELCSDQPYRDKSDVWAFGVILYECCSFKHPFDAGNQCALILKIIQSPVPPLPSPSDISQELFSLIQWTLQKDPTCRPTVRDILCERVVQKHLREHRMELPDYIPAHDGGPAHRRLRSESDPPTNAQRSLKSSTVTSKTRIAPTSGSATTEVRNTRVRAGPSVSTTAGAKVTSSSRARNIHQKQTVPSTNSAGVVNRLYPGKDRKDSAPMGSDLSHKIEPAERDMLENLNPAPGKEESEHDLGYGEEDYADEKFEEEEERDSKEEVRRASEGDDDDDGLDFDLDGGLNLYGQYRSPTARSSSDSGFKAAEENLSSFRNGGSLLPSHSKMILPGEESKHEELLEHPTRSSTSTDDMYVTLADPSAIDAVQQKEVH